MVQVLYPSSVHTRKTWKKLLAPGFGLAQLRALWPTGEWTNRWRFPPCLSPVNLPLWGRIWSFLSSLVIMLGKKIYKNFTFYHWLPKKGGGEDREKLILKLTLWFINNYPCECQLTTRTFTFFSSTTWFTYLWKYQISPSIKCKLIILQRFLISKS